MQFENMIVTERFAADVASIRFFPGVRTRMHFELLGTSESLAACLTNIRFFPGMCAHMYYQLSTLDERLRADSTLVRPFPGVYSHMPMQLPTMFERTFAHVTLVRPFFRMYTTMYTQILFDGERFATIFALIRFLAGMRTIMSSQSRRYRKSFPANIASVRILALFTVRAQMSLIRALLIENFLTQQAPIRLFLEYVSRGGQSLATARRCEHAQIRTAYQTFYRIYWLHGRWYLLVVVVVVVVHWHRSQICHLLCSRIVTHHSSPQTYLNLRKKRGVIRYVVSLEMIVLFSPERISNRYEYLFT